METEPLIRRYSSAEMPLYVFHSEGSLEADLWVLERTLRILFGEVGQVVKGMRQSITKRGLSGPKRKTLNGVANYLYRNRSRMHYNEYLANGWPIASGPVEGACKNLIKDRMERSGMRWTEQMAEAIVQLRAIATATVRGNTADKLCLHFVRVEPYIIPKRNLTGDSTERVDPRVLQVRPRSRRQGLRGSATRRLRRCGRPEMKPGLWLILIGASLARKLSVEFA